MMTRDSREYLEGLARRPRNFFEDQFSMVSLDLELCQNLNVDELDLLYDAALLGVVCQNALNRRRSTFGFSEEEHYLNLQSNYQAARSLLLATRGWKRMPEFKREAVKRHCLIADSEWV